MSRYAGAGWLRSNLERQGRTLSEFGAKVAEILGDLYLGIYHESKAVTHKRVNWSSEDYIDVVVSDNNFATFDGSYLTRLVVLCHDHCVRCEVQAATRGYLRLRFHPRHGRDGSMWERHPTMENAVEGCRKLLEPAIQ